MDGRNQDSMYRGKNRKPRIRPGGVPSVGAGAKRERSGVGEVIGELEA